MLNAQFTNSLPYICKNILLMIPEDLRLETDKVLLIPIDKKDKDDFLRLAQQDEDMWEYFTLNLGDEPQLCKWMDMAFADKKAGTRIPFTLIDMASRRVAGSTSIGNIS